MLNKWRTIKTIDFYTKKTKMMWSLPPNVFHIRRILEMLEYLYEEEKKDCFINNEESYKVDPTGFMVRITAYVMIVTNVEAIIKETYRYLKVYLKSIKYEKILPSNKKIKELTKDFDKYYTYRNKIFAHTSFAKQKDNEGNIDTLSTQFTSLHYISGSMLGIKDKNYCLGNSYIHIEGQPSVNLPEIDIINDHIFIREHFVKWANIFSDIIKSLENEKENLFKKGDFKDIIFRN